jgi:Skp family chaperone for outer membrane proteins
MKTLRLIVVSAVFTTIFTLSAFAQTTAKVGVIYSGAFEDEKIGITKVVAALNALENEFKPSIAALQALADKATAVGKEAQSLQDAYTKNPNGPIGPAQIQPKVDEYERLGTEYKRKEEDLKNSIARRRPQVTGPIYQEVGKILEQYAKEKGFTALFDGSQDEKGMLVFVDEKSEITKDFITYCNLKLAAPAAPKPTTPK